MKKCKDCEYFHIIDRPQIIGGECWDWGRVECQKYNLISDYFSKQKLNRLTCVEGKDGEVR